MSGDASSSRIIAQIAHSKNPQEEEANENEFGNSLNSAHFPPPRTPLNTIPDPSQLLMQPHELVLDSKDKLEAVRAGRLSGRKIESVDRSGTLATPRVSIRQRKPHSEPNSAQSTPDRIGSKVSLGGTMGAYAVGARTTHFSKGKDPSYMISRRNSTEISDFRVEAQHFELDEDPAFWADHNVQVLIRIRPLTNSERVSQGHVRCLRQESSQSLVWLGHPETRFTFDHIADETISQEKLFRVVGLPMVENCMSGYNSCMFAYGQTGSGKTYTMMGEINQQEGNLSEDSGITPRTFEYLFLRIRMEEERRRNEKLIFSCKCSFLEIYNEQITDLLEPSSTNLQLREDLRKGVYVENLTEHNVKNVNDVAKLLSQGAAYRKIAATNMNSESSRSHSVFTCIIESSWEKDSMNHFRFARLNLVDLAGSERQKSSGAEGDRLKEAANINKSLSTLGLVIMSLVDLAHGKHRHVPYRDSRLTFLLQDSLGGNSKTTIIANVSPSVCSALETLSTLKFAQRAKLIQNNAKINEDASGDVSTLQRQIQELKDQLSFVMKHHNFSTPIYGMHLEESSLGSCLHVNNSAKGKQASYDHNFSTVAYKKMKSMEATLIGAIRREKMAEMAVHKLEAEIERVNQLASQREEELQRNKMTLKFREEKMENLELLMDGSLPADHYLMKENKALKEEILLLQARIDKNPELTCFTLENLRLLERLQIFQNFYEQGERETLLAEISELRDQLLNRLQTKLKFSSRCENQDDDTLEELEACRNWNSKLMREIEELRGKLKKYSTCTQPVDEMASYARDVDLNGKDNQKMNPALVTQPSDVQKELMDARRLVEAIESEQAHLIEELPLIQEQNLKYMELLNKKDKVEREYEVRNEHQELHKLEKQNKGLMMEEFEDSGSRALQAKLEKLTNDLEQARLLNCQYLEDKASQLSHQHQVELICEQVEMEATRTILDLQEEVSALRLELNEKLCCTTQENMRLRNSLEAKEEEIRMLYGDWEKATFELASFLLEGSKSLEDASSQIESIVCSFPQLNDRIREQVERAARACIDKEEAILQLEKSLEDAQKMVIEMELKLCSLKEATIALNEYPQAENDQYIEEVITAGMLLNEKNNKIMMLESQLKCKEDHIIEAEKRANAAFLVVKWLGDCYKISHSNDIGSGIHISKLVSGTEKGTHKILEMQTHETALTVADAKAQLDLERLILESENAINVFYMEVETHIASLQTNMLEASSTYMKWVQDLLNEVREMRSILMELKEDNLRFQSSTVKLQASKSLASHDFEEQLKILPPIRDQVAKINKRLKIIGDSINKKINPPVYLSTDESLAEDSWSADNCLSGYSSSGSEFSNESALLGNQLDGSSYASCSESCGKHSVELKFQTASSVDPESENSMKLLKNSCYDESMVFCLRKKLDATLQAFNTLHAHLTTILDGNDIVDISYTGDMNKPVQSSGSRMDFDEVSSHNIIKVVTDDKVNRASSTFLCKFDEARETMKEADYMLNALLKENENAKQLNDMWKQASENLMAERSLLLEENEQLKASICSKEEQNKLLLDEIHHVLVEAANSLSFFEGCFQQMQKEVDGRCRDLFSHLLFMGKELFELICSSRSSLEDIFSKMIQKELAISVMYQCFLGELIHKIPSFNIQYGIHSLERQKHQMVMSTMQKVFSSGQDDIAITSQRVGGREELVKDSAEGGLGLSYDDMIYENMSLMKELERKEVLLKGLLFDFSLLQEATSDRKDIKDETEKLIIALGEVRQELEMKTSQLDNLLVQYRKVEGHLANSENALAMSISDLGSAKERIDTLMDQNAELRILVKDLYLKKSEAEEQLEEQNEVVRGLEKEIIHLSASIERKVRSSTESLKEELRKTVDERDKLNAEIRCLNDQLGMAYALADENEAVAVESRQESEASKIYAEQKEEEVKILEHSVEELECTINVLEKKVHEMDEEVERHRLIRESLELELQALRQRLLTVENFTDILDSENTNSVIKEDPISRQLCSKLLELHEAHNEIRHLERGIAEKDEEIKQCKEYISELILHSEAQASQFHDKYKTLEAMVHEAKTNLPNSASAAATLDKSDKSSVRTRGSSSPFRCISSLVQQMNLEKDRELSAARLQIEELEAALANLQKEVCVLNARLAAAESMTHDVIRDLLGVKFDMTNYANLIDQHQVHKLMEAAHEQTEELHTKEQEILNLRRQISDLIREKESCISEINRKAEDALAALVNAEQLQERDMLLSAQNEMLKMDKSNLLRRVAELDDMVKTLLGTRGTQEQIQQTSKTKEKGLLKMENVDLTERLAHSAKLLFRVNDELVQYRKSSSNLSHVKARRGNRI